jgi:DNA-binding transcriptional MerR regulator
MKQLTIGRLAELTGVTTDTLRYYEKMGLIKSASRSESGYRLYDAGMVRVIRFIRGAKALNFSLREIRRLLTYTINDQPRCMVALKHVEKKIMEAEGKIREFREIREALDNLANACHTDDPKKVNSILDYIQKSEEKSDKENFLPA